MQRLLAYLTALAILTVNLNFMPFILFREPWFPLDFYRLRINAAVALNEVTTEDASVAVLAAGVVPYYTGLPGARHAGPHRRVHRIAAGGSLAARSAGAG